MNIVAKALNYSNAQSVANRLSRLKKKFNLTISSTHGSSPVKGGANDFGAVGATATPTTTPRKRGRPAKKAPNPKTTEGDETPSKPTKTAGRKRKASDTDEDVDNEEPFTLKAEIKEEI